MDMNMTQNGNIETRNPKRIGRPTIFLRKVKHKQKKKIYIYITYAK